MTYLRAIRRSRAGACLTCLAFLLTTPVMATPQPPLVDRVLVNGEILTMDPKLPTASAVAIKGGYIVAVGSTAEAMALAGPKTEVIDLKGRTVVPGLVDSHIHGIRGGQDFGFETYWHDQTRLSDALRDLQADAQRRGPDKWVAVIGSWHPQQFAERRAPTASELSALLPDNPAYVQFLYDYAVVNKKAIEVLGLDTVARVPPGIVVERDSQNKATGKLIGTIGSLSLLAARISVRSQADRNEGLRLFLGELNRVGVTALIDPAAGDGTVFNPLFNLWQRKALTVRVGYRVSVLAAARDKEQQWFRTTLAYMPPGFGDDMLRFVGIGENLVIGMNDGVRQAPGFMPTDQAREELFQVATFAAERGYPIEIHAYTDDAANHILDAFERVASTWPIKDLRWAIAHINTGKAATFERMRKLGISYTVQMGPYFEVEAIAGANGPEAVKAAPPTRIALAHGLMVVGGTDSTRIGLINVWRAIEYHVSGCSVGNIVCRPSEQLLTREEALRLYTANAAWLTFDEQRRGSISPGKLADLAVLDAPFMRIPVERIHQLRSVLTLVGGEVVYRAPNDAAEIVPPSSR